MEWTTQSEIDFLSDALKCRVLSEKRSFLRKYMDTMLNRKKWDKINQDRLYDWCLEQLQVVNRQESLRMV